MRLVYSTRPGRRGCAKSKGGRSRPCRSPTMRKLDWIGPIVQRVTWSDSAARYLLLAAAAAARRTGLRLGDVSLVLVGRQRAIGVGVGLLEHLAQRRNAR